MVYFATPGRRVSKVAKHLQGKIFLSKGDKCNKGREAKWKEWKKEITTGRKKGGQKGGEEEE